MLLHLFVWFFKRFSKDFGDTPEVSSLFKKGTSFILRGGSSERNKLENNYHKS